ncbi:MAG TPA: DEAD/DEAH box helicase family protein [Thermodesulfovibrionia bacterium]|nr:DEAD/DEAH box helicase family protein [Thermodesulfovibrionia bacterium]
MCLNDKEQVKRKGYEIAKIAEPKSTFSVRVVSDTKGHSRVHSIKPDNDVVIGTLQTITSAYNDSQQQALKAFLASAKGKIVVVFDEAHHSPGPSYRKLLDLMREDLQEFASEMLDVEQHQSRLKEWQAQFFSGVGEHLVTDTLKNLFHVEYTESQAA